MSAEHANATLDALLVMIRAARTYLAHHELESEVYYC